MKFCLKSDQWDARKQVCGCFLSPEWVQRPKLAEPYVQRAAAAGFSGWLTFTRQMKQTILEPRVHDAVAALCRIVHRHGLKLILDTDPTWWAEDMIERDADCALWALTPVETKASYGRFDCHVEGPRTHRQIGLQEICAAYIRKGGQWRRLPEGALELDWQSARLTGIDVRGRVRGGYHGPVRMYLAMSCTSLLDHASPAYLRMQRELLERYADIPLDGVAWDEPGKGHSSLTTFRAGRGFLDFFRARRGYDLRERLIHLDSCHETPEAVRVRLDYYGVLSDMHYRCQDRHNRLARKLWGKDIICGTHQTWSGLPADLGAGVQDHFRLAGVLTAAWTDGGVDIERKYYTFPLMLADSIKKERGFRDCYYNDWTYDGRVDDYRFFNRFKTLFHVNTFTHTYSDHSEGLANMRFEPLRRAFEADVELQDRLDALIGERRAHTDVAIWYGWEGYAALPKWCARAAYTWFANTSLALVDAGLYGDFVSSPALAKAVVDGGRLRVNGRPYGVVVLPYAHVLPAAAYRTLRQAARAGVGVVFCGPPPAFTTEGKPIAFHEDAGTDAVRVAEFEDALRAGGVNIAPNAWEPPYIDAVCPVRTRACRSVRNAEDEIVLVQGRESGICWMPGLDPRQDLVDAVRPWCRSPAAVFSANAYHRLFVDARQPDDLVIVIAPREGVPGWTLIPECYAGRERKRPAAKPVDLDALVRVSGCEIRVRGRQWCALRVVGGRLTEWLADDDVCVEEMV